NEFNRIFYGHDIFGPGVVNQIDQGSQSGGFAVTRGSYHQHQTLPVSGQLFELRRQIELFHSFNLIWDQSQSQSRIAFLEISIGPEPDVVLEGKRKIKFADLAEFFP